MTIIRCCEHLAAALQRRSATEESIRRMVRCVSYWQAINRRCQRWPMASRSPLETGVREFASATCAQVHALVSFFAYA